MHTNNIKKGLVIAIALMSETSSILFDFQGDKALISRLAVGYLTLNSRCLNEQRNPIQFDQQIRSESFLHWAWWGVMCFYLSACHVWGSMIFISGCSLQFNADIKSQITQMLSIPQLLITNNNTVSDNVIIRWQYWTNKWK